VSPLTAEEAELLAGFEAGTLPPARFDHRAHLLCGWALLGRAPFLEAALRFCRALERFAAAAGAPGKYHETLSLALLALLHERRGPDGGHLEGEGFEGFLARNPELLSGWRAVLRERGYGEAALAGEAARRGLVLPRP
jgi:hypothetical protein